MTKQLIDIAKENGAKIENLYDNEFAVSLNEPCARRIIFSNEAQLRATIDDYNAQNSEPICFVDAGDLREVSNGNIMRIHASPEQDEQNRLEPLYLSPQPQAKDTIPAGCKLVPIEPSIELLNAMAMAMGDVFRKHNVDFAKIDNWFGTRSLAKAAYSALINKESK